MARAAVILSCIAVAAGLAAQQTTPKTHRLEATPTTVAYGYYWSDAKPALRIASGDIVDVDTLLRAFGHSLQADATSSAMTAPIASMPMSVDRMEWEHIQRVLREHKGNISSTARALNMHRRTLQRKLLKRPARQ